jgi:large subunit ribosomal protein L24
MQKLYKIRIKTGDTVMVRSGKYKGRTGKVLALYPKLNKAKVEGINVVKKHRKPTTQQPQGGIIDLTKPIWVSKLGIVDSVAKKPSRIGYKVAKDGSKVRVLKTSGKEIK